MRETIMAAVAASVIAGAGAGSLVQLAVAQQNPPPAPPGPAARDMAAGDMMDQHPGWMHHPDRKHWRHMHEGRLAGPHTFALFYHPADRQLTAADVRKIAEAFLLRNGNHAWKVADVTENPDNTVAFAYTAPDGTMIAKFSMDRKTGQITRLG